MDQIIAEIVTQHADEAYFLWFLRNNAVRAPHYSLSDLCKLDRRIEAHLDGMRVADERGWEIAKQGLENEKPGEVFTAAVLALESKDNALIQPVLEIAVKTDELSQGLVSALGWGPYEKMTSQINGLLNSESSNVRRIGIAACAIHRQDPGLTLNDALSSENPLLKARALRAIGELGRKDLVFHVKSNISAEEFQCQLEAALSGALLGEPHAVPMLQAMAEGGGPNSKIAATMAVRRLNLADAHGWQGALASRTETQYLSAMAGGVIGDPALIPWLIEVMAIPKLARVAGEAFAMITGIDIAYEDLEGTKPEGFEAGPTEDAEDENVEMDPDEDLAWPSAELVQKWWHAHRLEFQSGTRYLLGKPMTIEWLKQVLKIGHQRQRTAAAIELAIRQPGTPLFNTHAPGFRQMEMLKSI